MEGRYKHVKKRQVILATFWDFLRDRRPAAWLGLPSAFAAAFCMGVSGSQMRLGAQLAARVAATEPTCANQITVGGEVAVFADSAAVWLKSKCKFVAARCFSPPGDCEIQAA